MKLSLEIIYKRNRSTKQSMQSMLGFSDRQSILIKEKHKHFLMSDRVAKRLKHKGLF